MATKNVIAVDFEEERKRKEDPDWRLRKLIGLLLEIGITDQAAMEEVIGTMIASAPTRDFLPVFLALAKHDPNFPNK